MVNFSYVACHGGGKMSQPLLLLHPKKTSSLGWLNHMLTSWQRSAPSPIASLKAVDTGAPTRNNSESEKPLRHKPAIIKMKLDKYFPYINQNGLTSLRYSIKYNGQTRMWTVKQYYCVIIRLVFKKTFLIFTQGIQMYVDLELQLNREDKIKPFLLP